MIQKAKIVIFIMLLMVSFLAAEEYEQKIVRSFPLAAGSAIELANVNGVIGITTTSGAAAEIKAVKKSDYKGEIENVEVIFEAGKDALKVYVKYPKRHSRAKVDFTVVIPEKLARAGFKSVNGRIDCSGEFADLMLKTVNGRIDFKGQFRSGSFETVNGSLEISQEKALNGNLHAATVNGSIDIELNRQSAFAVEGRTINGSIDSDFGLPVSRHLVGRTLSGEVNGGGYKLEVETVNGSIQISKI